MAVQYLAFGSPARTAARLLSPEVAAELLPIGGDAAISGTECLWRGGKGLVHSQRRETGGRGKAQRKTRTTMRREGEKEGGGDAREKGLKEGETEEAIEDVERTGPPEDESAGCFN